MARSSRYLGDAEEASRVTQLPVTKLMGKDSDDLLALALLNQGIVDDNVLLPGETKEVGVGVGAALAAVNDVELVQGELEAGSESLDTGLELAILEGRQLVEQRQDSDRVDGDHEDLETSSEGPKVVEELVASLLNDSEETGEDRGCEDKGQELRLEQVGNEELGSLFVEAKLFFEDEGMVNRRGQAENLADNHEGQDEDNGVTDFTSEAFGSESEQEVTRPGPELRKDVEVDEGDVLKLAVETVDNAELGLGAAVGLGLVEDLLGDLLGENGGGTRLLENAILAEGEEGLEEVLADREAHDEALPWEERAIEEAREALLGGGTWLAIGPLRTNKLGCCTNCAMQCDDLPGESPWLRFGDEPWA